MKRRLLLSLVPIALLLLAAGVLAPQSSGEAQGGAVRGDSAGCAAAHTNVDGGALVSSVDSAGPSLASDQALLAAQCYFAGITRFPYRCGGDDLYVLRYLCYDPAKGWFYVNYAYCMPAPPCRDTVQTSTSQCRTHEYGGLFDVRFDCYGRVVYCANLQDYVTINWVELAMRVTSATEPLDCQGTEMGRRSLQHGEIYVVNKAAPFPLNVGDGWRGSIVFWDNQTFKKSNGLKALNIFDMAQVDYLVGIPPAFWTCGQNGLAVPACWHEWAAGWQFSAAQNQTSWAAARVDPAGLCTLWP
jgi:hypothetical protein